MSQTYNIYCDESCHLEHDSHRVMVLGAVWCSLEKTREIAMRLREKKVRHGLTANFEMKWNKMSPAKTAFYLDVLGYFFSEILWWKTRRGHEDRFVLALPDFSYVTVVADRGEYVLPWTAYCVERGHMRKKLRREFDEYWRKQKS